MGGSLPDHIWFGHAKGRDVDDTNCERSPDKEMAENRFFGYIFLIGR
jgi:hypothetical protein